MYIYKTKLYNWNDEKSELLLKNRSVCFEDIVIAIYNDKLLDVLEHPNKKKYVNQKIFVVKINDYAYLVPFVETEYEVFLKTIFASRKATRDYLGGRND